MSLPGAHTICEMELLATLTLDQLREPKFFLRLPNKQSVEYLELRDSIQAIGFLNSLCVRYTGDPNVFEIVDGWFRFNAARDVELTEVPCIVKEMTDAEVLASQIAANAIRPETKPVEMARHLKQLQLLDPSLTLPVIAKQVGKDISWVKNMLLLNDLSPEAQQAVDTGRMFLMNAYMLAKIPKAFQPKFIHHALHMPVKEFSALSQAVIKDYRLKKRKQRLEHHKFKPTPYLRSVVEIIEEMGSSVAFNKLAGKAHLSRKELWKAALEWALHLDVDSIEKQRQQAERRNQLHQLERKAYVADIDSVIPDP